MNILAIGDIVGRSGRRAVKSLLPQIIADYYIDFIIANGENASGGRGLNRDSMDELLTAGINVITMGNHVWQNKDIFNFIDQQPELIRPCNYPDVCQGQGYHIYTTENHIRIAVINASGRVFMESLDCPFKKVTGILDEIHDNADIIIVDIHAEATSEKLAFGYYFDGRVSAVLGTHTHVQTADERILPQGTAYITDLGMTGPVHSILGMDTNMVIKKFLTQQPVRLEVSKGEAQLQGVVLKTSLDNKKATEIIRLSVRHTL